MDKIVRYQQAIKQVFSQHAAPGAHTYEEDETQLVFDDIHGHYLLLRVGWNGSKRIMGITLHADLKGDKIWLQQNWTDSDIAEDLVREGVAREDIVLGLIAPDRRRFTAYSPG